jgi:cytochrome bd-type quinol oxidase subunit 2
MHAAPIIIVIALLALFLIAMTIFKYAIHDNFMRTRLTMSALFVFIVATLSISFWPLYSVPRSDILSVFVRSDRNSP